VFALLIVLSISLIVSGDALKSREDPSLKMSGKLRAHFNSLENKEKTVEVIVKLREEPAPSGGLLAIQSQKTPGDSVSERITRSGGRINHRYDIFSGLSADLPASSLEDLASDPSVERVYLRKKYQIFRADGIPLINADSASGNYSVNGSGINISILDTGIFNHSEFQTPDRIAKEKCFCMTSDMGAGGCCLPNYTNETDNATDDHSHGTHVAGIAAGEGGGGYGQGVAPEANIFAVKVCNVTGWCDDGDIIRGIEWSIQNSANIISMSLGDFVNNNCYEDALPTWVDNTTESGVLVVVAAGNCGPDSGSPYCPSKGSETITTPACAKRALSVGASDGSDGLEGYSSRGATKDNRTKPDLTAPGGTETVDEIWSTVLNNGYNDKYGTSMATPFVAGAAALLMERYLLDKGTLPYPDLVKTILIASADTSGMKAAGYSQRNNLYGSGRLDVQEALDIMNYTRNMSISQAETDYFILNATPGEARTVLYWPENETFSNDLDLFLNNGTVYSNPTDSNDSIEAVILDTPGGFISVTINATSVSGFQGYFLASNMEILEDTQAPAWSGNQSSTASTYSPSNLSLFNITWSDDFVMGEAYIEGNWSGSGQNYTMTNISGTYHYNTTLPAGDFYWRSHARDSSHNWNTSGTWYFTVSKASPNLTLLLNGTDSGLSINQSNYANMSAYLSVPGNLSLYINSTLTDSGTSPLENISAFPDPGLYNITAYFNGSQNYSASSSTHWLQVNDTSPPQISSVLIFPPHILEGEDIQVTALVNDSNLSSVWYNISNQTWSEIVPAGNSSDLNSTYNTSNLTTGSYSIVIYANDTSGTAGSNSSGYFTISEPSNLSLSIFDTQDNLTNASSIIILYNGTALPINTSDNTSSLSLPNIPTGIWDLKVLLESLNSTLLGVNLSGNFTSNITLEDSVDTSQANLPSGSTFIKSVLLETGMGFDSAYLSFPYDNTSFTNESRAIVYACHDWNITTGTCSVSWENITENSSIDISSDVVTIISQNLSVFSLSESHTCGDGIVDTGEACDGSDLDGESCTSLGYTGGTLSCSGSCTFVTSGCTSGTSDPDNGGGSFSPGLTRSLEIASYPVSLEALIGEERNFSVTVENTGQANLSDTLLYVSSECGSCTFSVSPDRVLIESGKSQEFSVTISVGIGEGIGNHTIEYIASSGSTWNQTEGELLIRPCFLDSTRCLGGNVQICNQSGWEGLKDCQYGCFEGECKTAGTSQILGNGECVPDQVICSENLLLSCDPELKIWIQKEECASCVDGQCVGNFNTTAIAIVIVVGVILVAIFLIYRIFSSRSGE
jgi:subtilisin family serine protease